MGYSVYPQKPGTKYGPCEGECKHTDCAKSRKDAASLCRICGKEIGYDNMVFFETNDELVHAECVWEAEEREAKIKDNQK